MGIFDIFTGDYSARAAREAAAVRAQGYDTALTNANSALDTGYGKASDYLDRALVPFSDLLTRGTSGYDRYSGAYADATGLNGAEGAARAKTAFTSLPGFTEGINMALDQNDRRAAARGMLGSGNTIADTTKLATDYASQKYSDYLSSLLPGLNSGQQIMTTGAAGSAGVLGQQGTLANDIGKTKAGIGYQAAVGSSGAQAGGIEAEQKARDDASKNFWGALMGGANLAAKAFMPF